MNNNRNNNRRRGRGNNRQQGGGQPINRIDSRARGNAPQLLEKYRKQAHDAHLNGDRVTEEYYLQFADHYFRVIADSRQRQEDARQRRDDRWEGNGENDRYDQDAGGDYGSDGDYGAGSYPYAERRPREDAPRYNQREEQLPETRDDTGETGGEADTGNEAEAAPSPYEPAVNPFTRDGRSNTRGLRPRRDRDSAGKVADEPGRAARDTGDAGEDRPSLDVAALPPSISARDSDAGEADDQPAAKPKRRTTRKAKPPTDDTGEALQTVS